MYHLISVFAGMVQWIKAMPRRLMVKVIILIKLS